MFTVVLLYPDYMTEDHGADMYVAAAAGTPEEAVEAVRADAASVNPNLENPDDMRMILVIKGDVEVVGDTTGIYQTSQDEPDPTDTNHE